jgi:hypothetical protein
VAVGVELIKGVLPLAFWGREVGCQVWSRLGKEFIKQVVDHWVLGKVDGIWVVLQTKMTQEVVGVRSWVWGVWGSLSSAGLGRW